MKYMLMIASVPSMIGQFNMDNINILLDLGYKVDVACDFNDRSVWTEEKVNNLRNKLDELNIEMYQIDFSRSVTKVDRHIKAYRQLVELLKEKKYNFVHCHSPIGGAITRLACKKTNTKCIYTAHGFHFYKGAPIQNWMLFYPIEKYLSRYTDILITINQEDYSCAKKKFYTKKVEYVPGVGVDIDNIKSIKGDRDELISQIKVSPDSYLMLSVGELTKRKNHKLIISILPNLSSNVHYLIVGKGPLRDTLENLSKKYGVSDRVHFLGYRSDVVKIMKSCDLFLFPSLQEGLPVALMEAIASNMQCLVSDIRGNSELAEKYNKVNKFKLGNLNKLVKMIEETDEKNNRNNLDNYFDISSINVKEIMNKIYKGV